jgi:hypothetical protein
MADEAVIAPAKPGYKTTEFWLTALAQGVGILLTSGVIDDSTGVGKIVGVVAMALSAAGYSVSRGKAKAA